MLTVHGSTLPCLDVNGEHMLSMHTHAYTGEALRSHHTLHGEIPMYPHLMYKCTHTYLFNVMLYTVYGYKMFQCKFMLTSCIEYDGQEYTMYMCYEL